MTERGLRTKINPIDDACDFKYIKRTYEDGYAYHFLLRGTTEGYIWNKYRIYDIFGNSGVDLILHVYKDFHMVITCGVDNDNVVIVPEETDRKMFQDIVTEEINRDISNWEEYCCNDDYKKDPRWE